MTGGTWVCSYGVVNCDICVRANRVNVTEAEAEYITAARKGQTYPDDAGQRAIREVMARRMGKAPLFEASSTSVRVAATKPTLIFDESQRRFLFRTTKGAHLNAKALGFWWNPKELVWSTKDPLRAAQLIEKEPGIASEARLDRLHQRQELLDGTH